MTRRQPEIGSALGLSTDLVVNRAGDAEEVLRALREDLISALAKATEATTRREPAIDVILQLHHATQGMLDRWRS